MSAVLDVLSWVLLVSGGVISVVAGIGILRMPDLFSRMHAASMLDTLGAACVLGGLILQAGFTVVAFKLFAVLAFLAITTSTAAHALAKSALADGLIPHGCDPESLAEDRRAVGGRGSAIAVQADDEEVPSSPA